jgi:hypothetical protein
VGALEGEAAELLADERMRQAYLGAKVETA